jgi:hypothetical protein
MEQNKYYTPEIYELFVGYECEVVNMENYKTEYQLTLPYKIKLTGIIDNQIWFKTDKSVFELENINQIRIPYLTQEDIESEGWKMVWGEAQCLTFSINNIILTKFNNSCSILIDYSKERRLFDGECKSINELRTIQKLLKIK